jgi:hypothetical protein
VLGVLSTLLGFGLAAVPFVVHGAGGGAPWAYKHTSPGFEVTLPSERWQKVEKLGELAMFSCRAPQMIASIKEIRPAASSDEFESAVNDVKRLVSRNPVKTIEEKREPNANGHDHWRLIGEENSPNGRVMVAMSVTWWNKSRAVIMIFEGQYKMASQLGQSQETDAFRAAATSILSSVK